jgi:hypothetical protein
MKLLPALLLALVPGLAAQAIRVVAEETHSVHLKYAVFDPLRARPQVPATLAGGSDVGLWIVQFRSRPTEAMRAAVRAAGGELSRYLPANAYVVRMPLVAAGAVGQLADVRWVGVYQPAYRLDPALLAEHLAGQSAPVRRYNLVVFDKHRDKPVLGANIRALGGTVVHEQPGSLLFQVALDRTQLLQTARLDQVLWIDRWSPPQLDMDNARKQGGADYVEAQAGYTGAGVVGHVFEGVQVSHPDFTVPPVNVMSCGSAAAHGHCTAGIVFGNGTSHVKGRGMAPAATFFYTTHDCLDVGVSRWQVFAELVTNRDVAFSTASWGAERTRDYTSVSAEADDIVFDHDIVWTQSQSNAGNQDSRPEAWAKNVFSVGALFHNDNDDPSDDAWWGAASIGPAADGRIKPDFCAYFDWIWTSDLQGTAGYAEGDDYVSFGGTSGATPIVAGHNALAIQMFTDALFGNALRNPGGSRFSNRPRAATLRALMTASARQYPFTPTSTDTKREHQGWGFPDLRALYDLRAKTFVVDETVALEQGQMKRYVIRVVAGEPALRIAMCYADPAGNPAASLARINDMSLRVTSPAGTVYHGNQGLWAGPWSVAGGTADDRNTVECVFVQNPADGEWLVDVIATLVAEDARVETPAVDADFGLVVFGGTDATAGTFVPFGQGCPGTGGSPLLTMFGNPDIGTVVTFQGTNMPADSAVALLIGESNTTWGAIPLPFNFGIFGAPLCNLLVSTENVLPTRSDANGIVSKEVYIPRRPAFVGARVYSQFLVLDIGANPFGLTVSGAGTLKVGD